MDAGNHPVDVPAGARVDERIKTVEEHVPHVQHVGLREEHEDVGVGVRGRDVPQIHLLAVDVQRETGGEGLGRQLRRGRRIKMHPEQVVRLGQTRPGVLVRDDAGALGPEVCVVVGVIEVPVCVDHRLDRRAVDRRQGGLQLRPRRLDEPVDDDRSVGAVEHQDVAAGAGEHGQPFGELRRHDGRRPHLRAHRVRRVGLEGLEERGRGVAVREGGAGAHPGGPQEGAAGRSRVGQHP